MGTIIGEKRILKSTLEPPNRNWLWLKTVDGTPVLHEYINGYWTPFATTKTNSTAPVDTMSFGEVDYDPITRRINFYSSNDTDHAKVLGYIDTIPFELTVDAKIRQAIASLQNAIDAITSGDTTTAIKTFQEVIDFLDGVTDDDTLIGKLNELHTLIAAKYTKPASGIPASDLADGVIPDVSGFATKTEVNAKANSADVYSKTEVDTKVADAGKVKSVSINNGTPEQPDAQGNVNLTFSGGGDTDIVGLTVPSPNDGTVVFTKRNDDTVTVNLNHTHPQYLKYELLADEAAYEAIAIKDNATLYLIPVEEE